MLTYFDQTIKIASVACAISGVQTTKSYGLTGRDYTTTKWMEKYFPAEILMPMTRRDAFIATYRCPYCSAGLIFQVRFASLKKRPASAQRFVKSITIAQLPGPDTDKPHYLSCKDRHGKNLYATEIYFNEKGAVIGGSRKTIFAEVKALTQFDRRMPELFTREGILLREFDLPTFVNRLSPDELGIVLVERPEASLTALSEIPDGRDLLKLAARGGKGIEKLDPRPTHVEIIGACSHFFQGGNQMYLAWSLLQEDARHKVNEAIFFCLWMAIVASCVGVWFMRGRMTLPLHTPDWVIAILLVPLLAVILTAFFSPVYLVLTGGVVAEFRRYMKIIKEPMIAHFKWRIRFAEISILLLTVSLAFVVSTAIWRFQQ